ncbi:DEAD/DEAH box helicase [Xanthobacter sp. TB0136]|uniref:DEAD/DEAH box helicase n=1 Tax=Xanthobacter sp. TB0136 TaxID=3459177 RepID=UPI00403A3C19
MTSFSTLGLAEPVLRALNDAGYTTPTPIQAQAIPQVLAGRDLIGIAQTGTGKTAAFALPIMDYLVRNPRRLESKSVRVLVLSPTRELSGQIQDNFETFGRHTQLSVALAIGGVPMGRQVRTLHRGVDVLVATPGRLLDLADNHAVRLDQVEVIVLDEADQMLDMGFVHAIKAILRRLPRKRHSLFFSATMPTAIAELANSMLHNPAQVAVTPVSRTADKVEQRVVLVDKPNKGNLLAEVLSQEPVDRALVFTRTKHGADKVVRTLARVGIAAEAIHGNKSQNQRDRVLAAFREGQVRVLVATDIAARGIDVSGVSHVVNYDLPNVPESYVHRIGRTARAGREGIAISFCDHEERPYLRSIERLIRIQIPSSDRRGAQASFNVPAGKPIVQDEWSEDAPRARNGRRPAAPGQRQRPRGERPAEAGSGEAVRREGRRPQRNGAPAGAQQDKRNEPRAAEGRPDHRKPAARADGRTEGRAEHRNTRTPRGPRPSGEMAGIGFMKASPRRGGSAKSTSN